MGTDYIDYIIADRYIIPLEYEIFYTESVVYLPDTYQVNDTKRQIARRTPTRAELKLPDTGFIFCCFNNNFKITPEIFDVWMRLLNKVDDSVLWLLDEQFSCIAQPTRGGEVSEYCTRAFGVFVTYEGVLRLFG